MHNKLKKCKTDSSIESHLLQTVLAQIMSPLVPSSGSKLAKVINVNSNAKTMEFFGDTSFMKAGWSQKIATPWGMMDVCFTIFVIL